MTKVESKNMRLIAQNTLVGFGGMGEGMSMQIAKDGRRVLWLAHESAPKNFTGVDVSDPKNPKDKGEVGKFLPIEAINYGS